MDPETLSVVTQFIVSFESIAINDPGVIGLFLFNEDKLIVLLSIFEPDILGEIPDFIFTSILLLVVLYVILMSLSLDTAASLIVLLLSPINKLLDKDVFCNFDKLISASSCIFAFFIFFICIVGLLLTIAIEITEVLSIVGISIPFILPVSVEGIFDE